MNWLIGDWHELLPTPWSVVGLTAVAVVCGVIVGAEREKKEKPAGLRTMVLVSLGAALFTMLSLAVGGEQGDRARIAAQIVTGVGFLGAGAILRGPAGVQGLTTAATIWAMVAVGMVVGAGYAGAGLALSLSVLLVLTAAAALEHRYLGPCEHAGCEVVFHPAGDKTTVKIEDILDDYKIGPESRKKESVPDGLLRFRFNYCHAHKHHKEFLTQLADIPDVREISAHG